MSKTREISRRDFLNGVLIGAAAGTALSPLRAAADFGLEALQPSFYPPRLTGMRGDHVGSFEVAHAFAFEGREWARPERQTDSTYDMVVVGGGISGLAAAWMYRAEIGPEAKILILDNHDDFGGHAKRNEFTVDGHKLIGYGGSMTIEEPKHYSPVAKQLLKDISIDVQRFYSYFNQDFDKQWNLESKIYFRKDVYGSDRLVSDPFGTSYTTNTRKPPHEVIAGFPLRKATRDALIRLSDDDIDFMTNIPVAEKPEILKHISYVDFLSKYAGVPREGTDLLRDKLKGVWAIGWDALSAMEGARLEMPGTAGLGLSQEQLGWNPSEEPYIFHFPDGNAGVARALVRGLIPGSLPGHTMEDLVTSRAEYGGLDDPDNAVRIRLNSTAVKVVHTPDGKEVDITYIQEGMASRVRGKHVILACNNRMVPYLCEDVPEEQIEAIDYATRVPLVYINIALRNWKAFLELRCNRIYIPEADMMHTMTLDFPVSMGSYHFSNNPEEPIVVHGAYIPNTPGQSLTNREQFVIGRQKLYELRFGDFEADVYKQMSGALAGSSFDAERDIAAITVNRWPHGYAYEYSELFDPPGWDPQHGPHIAGRAQMGRISIANSDASAYAYVDGAIDAAARAVKEQVDIG